MFKNSAENVFSGTPCIVLTLDISLKKIHNINKYRITYILQPQGYVVKINGLTATTEFITCGRKHVFTAGFGRSNRNTLTDPHLPQGLWLIF